MRLQNNTISVLLALYMVFGLPLCCCYISAASACCSPDRQSDSAVVQTAFDTSYDGHTHDHGHSHQDQDSEDDQDTDPSTPCEHDDLCSCESDAVKSLLVKKSITIDYPTLAAADVSKTSPFVTIDSQGFSPLVMTVIQSSTSLVRMHCALII